MSPASGVTMPWRSLSASLPVAMSYLSRAPIREAMAEGEEQSMRIFSSQSRVMNAHCGSTVGFTTSRFSPKRSPISCQYATDAEPMGSAPMRTPAALMASRSMISGSADT